MIRGERMKNFYLSKALLFVSLFYLILTFSFAGETATGIVFEDKNQNLKKDFDEKRIAKVMVSNQHEVVLTDESGQFSIPVDESSVIFITKPAGYNVPLNNHNQPQFYFIHQPKGSPSEYKYPGVSPTGALPESIEFPLFKSEEPAKFEALIFGDPQPHNQERINYLRDDILADLLGTDAAFSLSLGDIAGDNLAVYDPLIRTMAALGIPNYYLPGNHDTNNESAGDEMSLETYKSKFGPSYYSFDYGQTHFVIMDSVEWHGATKDKKAWYRGMFGKRQLEWLTNDLQYVPKDKLVVFAMHIAPYTIISNSASDNIIDREAMFRIIEDREHLLILTGHNHTSEHHFIGEAEGWKGKKPLHIIICTAMCGSWYSGPKDERGIPAATQQDGAPNGYYVFRFDGNQCSEKFIPAGLDHDFQIRIESPVGTIKAEQIKDLQVVANIFDGSARSTVTCQIDTLAPSSMNQQVMKSPFFDRLIKENKDKFRSWIQPCPSNHFWTSPLPADLKPGLHTIVVKTTDQFGNTFSGKAIFEIEP